MSHEIEVENLVDIGANTFDKLKEMYPIEVINEENGVLEVYVSNIGEEEFEDFGLEWSAYHENPNEYFDLLKHNWHTNRTMFVTLFDDDLPSEMSF